MIAPAQLNNSTNLKSCRVVTKTQESPAGEEVCAIVRTPRVSLLPTCLKLELLLLLLLDPRGSMIVSTRAHTTFCYLVLVGIGSRHSTTERRDQVKLPVIIIADRHRRSSSIIAQPLVMNERGFVPVLARWNVIWYWWRSDTPKKRVSFVVMTKIVAHLCMRFCFFALGFFLPHKTKNRGKQKQTHMCVRLGIQRKLYGLNLVLFHAEILHYLSLIISKAL